MFDVTAMVGTIGGIFGSLMALGSVVYQRRQTQLMAVGLEKSFEISEGETGTESERKLRAVINKRLSENRVKLRQEFVPRLDRLEQILDDNHIKDCGSNLATLIRLLDDQQDIKDLADDATRKHTEIMTVQERVLAETGRYSADIATHGREIEVLQQQLEDLQNGIRTQIRAITQHLLQMTSQV